MRPAHKTSPSVRETEQFSDRRRSARPRATTVVEDKFLITIAKQEQRRTTSDITQQRRSMIAITTAKKPFLNAGLSPRFAVKKIIIRTCPQARKVSIGKDFKNTSGRYIRTTFKGSYAAHG